VLALRRKVLGPEHADTVNAMNDLANSYDVAKRGEEALKMREEVLALSRKVLGPEHPDTLNAMQRLANSFDVAKRADEALQMREEVLALRRKVLGPEHADTVNAMNGLAWFLATSTDEILRNPDRAVELATQATNLAPENALFANTLGVALYRAGDYTAAIPPLQKSLSLSKEGSAIDGFFLAMAAGRPETKIRLEKITTRPSPGWRLHIQNAIPPEKRSTASRRRRPSSLNSKPVSTISPLPNRPEISPRHNPNSDQGRNVPG